MYLERETSGATLAENCCANKAMTKAHKQKTPDRAGALVYLERETRFELATCTLARYRSTN